MRLHRADRGEPPPRGSDACRDPGPPDRRDASRRRGPQRRCDPARRCAGHRPARFLRQYQRLYAGLLCPDGTAHQRLHAHLPSLCRLAARGGNGVPHVRLGGRRLLQRDGSGVVRRTAAPRRLAARADGQWLSAQQGKPGDRMSNPVLPIAVIGAGVVGLSTALYLRRSGRDVTIIDPLPPPGGASYGNAGMISADTSVPIALPGMLRKVPSWLTDPLGPLAVRPSYFPKALPWLMKWIAASRMSRVLDDVRFGVSRVGLTSCPPRPPYPKQQTFPDPVGTSHLCHQRKSDLRAS